MAQRTAVAIAAMFPKSVSYTRDISQAYLQSNTELERSVYLRPPTEMEVDDDCILRARKPLYVIPESGLHWFVTYQKHHVEKRDMRESPADNCFLYSHNVGLAGPNVTVLQFDDSFGFGSQDFFEREETHASNFKCKPRTVLQLGESNVFNGVHIGKENFGYSMEQSRKIHALEYPQTDKELISVRAAVQYIATCMRPDVSSATQILSGRMILPGKAQ